MKRSGSPSYSPSSPKASRPSAEAAQGESPSSEPTPPIQEPLPKPGTAAAEILRAKNEEGLDYEILPYDESKSRTYEYSHPRTSEDLEDEQKMLRSLTCPICLTLCMDIDKGIGKLNFKFKISPLDSSHIEQKTFSIFYGPILTFFKLFDNVR